MTTARPSGANTASHREARRLYPLDGVLCEAPGCEKPATHRHHVDNDPSNNARENVSLLCASCHIRQHWQDPDFRARASRRPGVRTPSRCCEWCGRPFRSAYRHKAQRFCGKRCAGLWGHDKRATAR